jgi:hypothetical protein
MQQTARRAGLWSPIIRIIRKVDLITIHDFVFDVVTTIVIGKSKAISTSKFRKITAIRKYRSENGSRADLFGSNPHSNGDLFSRSSIFFVARTEVSTITIIVNVIVIAVAVATFKITYINLFQTSCLEVKYTYYIR